jgi:hypothetical protein
MTEETQKNPYEIAEIVLEKYLQGKSYHFVEETAKYLKVIAITKCVLPVN